MTKIRKSILLLLFVFTNLITTAQQNKYLNFEFPHQLRNIQNKYNFDNNMSKYDVIFQDLSFEIDPSIYYIKGSVSVNYNALENLDSLILNLSDSLTVDSIKQRNNFINFIQLNNLLRIDIENIFPTTIDSVVIYYQGKPTDKNQAFFIGVQDSTDYIPVLATLSEPYGASDWWPCKNNLSDKIDSININITCPSNTIGVSLGLLKNVETIGSKKIFHWEHKYPITPYLVSISVSDYYEYHSYIHYNTNDSLLFLNYLYRNNLTSKKNQIDKTEWFVNVYDSLFIDYPFSSEKYGHAEFPIGGGMEHQTISSMGRFDYEIISHELAHQWFGDYVTCKSWEDLWLNEGFATYCTGLCYENLENGYWYPFWKEVSIDKITTDSSGTVFPTDTNDLSILFSARLTYRKASYILHMIRWTIGDENFFQAIRNYLNNENLAFSFAKTPDLIAHFEQQADTSLSEFMNDWFYGEGYPIYDIEWSQNNENNFRIQINQNSILNDNHFFKLFVPIRVIGENDTINLKLNNQLNHQEYDIAIDFAVDTVIFDPELWLISKYSSVNSGITRPLASHLSIYPNPSTDLLIVKTNSKIIDIQINNINGNTIRCSYDKGKISTNSLAKGIYFITIKTLNGTVIKKFIKQ